MDSGLQHAGMTGSAAGMTGSAAGMTGSAAGMTYALYLPLLTGMPITLIQIGMNKIKITYLVVCGLIVLFAGILDAGQNILDDLSTSKPGHFPKRWRTWPLHRGNAETVYSVEEENGVRYINASDDHDASEQIFLNFVWKLAEKPSLSWKWRAKTLPTGAKESDDSMNDSACGVYVIFGKFDGHAIKYVWSSTLPVGNTVSRRGGKLKMKVLDSGVSKKGKWVQHSVNIPADYEALFGKKPDKDPSGIAILTDGNAVHKPAECDYTAFSISEL